MQRRLLGILCYLVIAPAVARDLPLHLIKLPPGFKIELYAADVPNARSMSMSPGGTLFVGSRQAGKVYAIRDSNRDGRGDKVYVIARGLNMPNGVAFHKGALYVAEINRILRFDDIETHLSNPPQPVVISTDFPADKHHGWKFIRIGPDEKLYVPIGAPCNVCIEYGYAVITRLNLDGSEHEIFAEGIRNSVGFDWHPDSHELWFTDNGRDNLSDDSPPDELNRAPDDRMHFGFPYCHGGEVLDPEFGLGHRCAEYVAPVQKLGAHVAALGMRFYVGEMFPANYRKQVFIAEHGSWNRTAKSGYRLTVVSLSGDKAVGYETFAEGWLQGQAAWGRPVDIEHMADGSLLVSDDQAGAIYRIYYDGKAANRTSLRRAARQRPQPLPETQPIVPPAMQQANPQDEQVRQATPLTNQSETFDKKSLDNREEPPVPVAVEPEVPAPVVNRVEGNEQQNVQTVPVKTNTEPLDAKPLSHPEQAQPSVAPQPTVPAADIKQTEGKGQILPNSGAQQDKSGPVPPADVIEKIRARTEQNTPAEVDPFSSVNKQTINQ